MAKRRRSWDLTDIEALAGEEVEAIREAWLSRTSEQSTKESWSALCERSFYAARFVRWPSALRAEMVATLRGAGMSTRAIGAALALGDKSVREDLEEAGAPSPQYVMTVSGRTVAPVPAPR